MVLDSSAIVALILNEPESARLQAKLQSAPIVLVGAPTVLEASIVLSRFLGPDGRKSVAELLAASDAEVIPFTSQHEFAAYEAFLRFGKGRHPASLNYGDCMAYAISKVAVEPLLFVGSDFTQTDIRIAN